MIKNKEELIKYIHKNRKHLIEIMRKSKIGERIYLREKRMYLEKSHNEQVIKELNLHFDHENDHLIQYTLLYCLLAIENPNELNDEDLSLINEITSSIPNALLKEQENMFVDFLIYVKKEAILNKKEVNSLLENFNMKDLFGFVTKSIREKKKKYLKNLAINLENIKCYTLQSLDDKLNFNEQEVEQIEYFNCLIENLNDEIKEKISNLISVNDVIELLKKELSTNKIYELSDWIDIRNEVELFKTMCGNEEDKISNSRINNIKNSYVEQIISAIENKNIKLIVRKKFKKIKEKLSVLHLNKNYAMKIEEIMNRIDDDLVISNNCVQYSLLNNSLFSIRVGLQKSEVLDQLKAHSIGNIFSLNHDGHNYRCENSNADQEENYLIVRKL